MTRRAHLSILTLLAAALFLRALVPIGWMPVAKAGPFAIQPCPAVDAVPATTHHHHGSSRNSHDGNCAFAPLHAGFAPIVSAPMLATPAEVTELPLTFRAITSFATGPPAPPPPATGPPAIA